MISNLEYFRVFLYVANFKSFTKAAEFLCVSQSAVSQSIKKLEEELDCTLLIRKGRSVQLTSEGNQLFKYVQQAIQTLYTGENTVSKMKSSGIKELKIGATETCLRYYLAPRLKKYIQEYPQVHITFMGATMTELCQMLSDGDIEIAFLFSPLSEEYHFQLDLLDEVQDIPAAAPSLGLDPEHVYTIEELSHQPLISVSTKNQVRFVYDSWFLSDGIPFAPDYVVQGMTLVKALAMQGLGVGILPEPYVKREIEEGLVFQIKTPTLPKPRLLYAAHKGDLALFPAASEFLEEMKKTEQKG